MKLQYQKLVISQPQTIEYYYTWYDITPLSPPPFVFDRKDSKPRLTDSTMDNVTDRHTNMRRWQRETRVVSLRSSIDGRYVYRHRLGISDDNGTRCGEFCYR